MIHLIKDVGYYGYLILFLIIFLESFPLTFYLPGDSLLFTTGFLASQGIFSMPLLLPTLFIASILGYNFSYFMGERLRNFILKSNDRYWFKKKHLDYTQEFFDKYGDKTVIIGRFIPIVRSFAPTMAGAVKMPFRQFILDSLIGGFFWTVGITSLGFYLGRTIPGVEKYLHYMVFLIIFVSFLPSIYEYVIARKKKKPLALDSNTMRYSTRVILVNNHGEILVMRRSETAPRHPLHWDIPGGRLEQGEDPMFGAIRELREETGVDLNQLSFLSEITAPSDLGDVWNTKCYFGHVGDASVMLSYEHDDMKWIRPEEYLNLKISERVGKFIEYFIRSSKN